MGSGGKNVITQIERGLEHRGDSSLPELVVSNRSAVLGDFIMFKDTKLLLLEYNLFDLCCMSTSGGDEPCCRILEISFFLLSFKWQCTKFDAMNPMYVFSKGTITFPHAWMPLLCSTKEYLKSSTWHIVEITVKRLLFHYKVMSVNIFEVRKKNWVVAKFYMERTDITVGYFRIGYPI